MCCSRAMANVWLVLMVCLESWHWSFLGWDLPLWLDITWCPPCTEPKLLGCPWKSWGFCLACLGAQGNLRLRTAFCSSTLGAWLFQCSKCLVFLAVSWRTVPAQQVYVSWRSNSEHIQCTWMLGAIRHKSQVCRHKQDSTWHCILVFLGFSGKVCAKCVDLCLVWSFHVLTFGGGTKQCPDQLCHNICSRRATNWIGLCRHWHRHVHHDPWMMQVLILNLCDDKYEKRNSSSFCRST